MVCALEEDMLQGPAPTHKELMVITSLTSVNSVDKLQQKSLSYLLCF